MYEASEFFRMVAKGGRLRGGATFYPLIPESLILRLRQALVLLERIAKSYEVTAKVFQNLGRLNRKRRRSDTFASEPKNLFLERQREQGEHVGVSVMPRGRFTGVLDNEEL